MFHWLQRVRHFKPVLVAQRWLNLFQGYPIPQGLSTQSRPEGRGLNPTFLVTLLEVHKLMYFMQVAGEPLKLRFKKERYGPYAENLRHVLHLVEGHFISGFADGGDTPGKPLELLPHAVKEAEAVLNQSEAHATRQRFKRVAALVEGFESSFGLELLSTVHWILEHGSPKSQDELVASIYGWNTHKKCFSPRQIALAADVMAEKGWR